MKTTEVLHAWGRVLSGRAPLLSIEITRECPLSCPGCYAYNEQHLSSGVPLRRVRDLRGAALVEGVLALVRKHKPLHVSFVGGEPLVRLFELEQILPKLTALRIHCQVVTSAVRAIPAHWQENPRIHVAVSIDGLQPEHDARRKPATYARILRNIEGRAIKIHCTITRQMLARPGYLAEFMRFWEPRPEVQKVWMSLYTPQKGEISSERLTAEERERVVRDLVELRTRFAKLDMPKGVLEAYLSPPASPRECMFAQTTETISADLKTKIVPCQFGGTPDCSECGCMASAGLHSIGQHRLAGRIRIGAVYLASRKVGAVITRLRNDATV